MKLCAITDEYQFKGNRVVFMENRYLRVKILVDKGSDILEVLDKVNDLNLLYILPNNWKLPGSTYVPSITTPESSWNDYYPGGWQDVLPFGGEPTENSGAAYGLHGETSLSPWNYYISKNTLEEVELTLRLELVRYPFEITKKINLKYNESKITINETIVNLSAIDLEYIWLQHMVFGGPLLNENTKINIPAEKILTNDVSFPYARLPENKEFNWPNACSVGGENIDLSKIPPETEKSHDICYLTSLQEGMFEIINPELNTGVRFSFDKDLFQHIWYWMAFGGFEISPFFGRNWNLGIMPSTSISASGLDVARNTNTVPILKGNKSVSTQFVFEVLSDVSFK